MSVLMVMCKENPQLLRYQWAIDLVHCLKCKVDHDELTALIHFFKGMTWITNFNFAGFRLLWDCEKNIKKHNLILAMRKYHREKEIVIAAATDAAGYFE